VADMYAFLSETSTVALVFRPFAVTNDHRKRASFDLALLGLLTPTVLTEHKHPVLAVQSQLERSSKT
jgi:hypothetical protein